VLVNHEAREEVRGRQAAGQAQGGDVLVVVERQADVAEQQQEGHQHLIILFLINII